MPWNWELPNWPHFIYNPHRLSTVEKQFFLELGSAAAFLKTVPHEDYQRFVVEILSQEGLESSRIEGEFLDRESLQSSIKQHFGINNQKSKRPKESGMADLLCDVYRTYNEPLQQDTLFNWHRTLFQGVTHLDDIGRYRKHEEPMQIVSNRYDERKVFFEAPPSKIVSKEMDRFIKWFNQDHPSVLTRAAVAHVYFESIHPFEDGNGRIGRLLVEKVLSQGVDRPVLIAVSKILERRKKEYYAALERCNKTLEIDHWLDFFGEVVLQAQKESMDLLNFLIVKSKLMTRLAGQLNPRQEKVLMRIFAEGLSGFKGGLSAENYIAITKTSRATATRDLADLVEKGAFTKTGELRHTRYWLNTLSYES